MRLTLLVLFTLSAFVMSFGQSNQNTLSSNADSDPAAKSILEKMRNKYEGYSTLDIDFTLEIKFPDEPVEVQNINFKKKGEGYRVEMASLTSISDGKTLWIVLPKNKEVQINNVPEVGEDESIFSPASLFTMYERDDYAFYLVGQTNENGKVVQKIEFKPLSQDSDYSKMRLTIVKGSNEFVRVKAFGKDGSRYTISAKKITPNKSIATSMFTFNKADYPDFYVEDLR